MLRVVTTATSKLRRRLMTRPSTSHPGEPYQASARSGATLKNGSAKHTHLSMMMSRSHESQLLIEAERGPRLGLAIKRHSPAVQSIAYDPGKAGGPAWSCRTRDTRTVQKRYGQSLSNHDHRSMLTQLQPSYLLTENTGRQPRGIPAQLRTVMAMRDMAGHVPGPMINTSLSRCSVQNHLASPSLGLGGSIQGRWLE